jgi:SPP1 family predicted phage head-tail adaptor
MNIGEFRDRVAVKRLTKTADGYGGFTSTQSTVATVWAKLQFTDGDMSFVNDKRQLNKGIDLTIRKNTATTNIQVGDVLYPERDDNEYRINTILEENLYFYKIKGNRTA